MKRQLKLLIINMYRNAMSRLGHISYYRNHTIIGPFIHFLATASSDFLQLYENHNYDIQTNGELFVLQALTANPISCIFDVGANKGSWSLAAHKLFPKAKIHAFEIAQPTALLLFHNLQGIPNVIVNDFGLGEQAGKTKIRYYKKEDYLTTGVDYQSASVPLFLTGTLEQGDYYARKKNIHHIDFLKIDVEGMEHHVLHGFANMISTHAIDVIQFEYGSLSIITKFLLRDFYLFFDTFDYKVGKIYPTFVLFKEYDMTDENFLGPNYLAISPKRRDLIRLLSSQIP
jgi:FkbM family methyltransferase